MEDFDSKFILKQLHVKYGVTPYFRVSVEPNPLMPGHSSITITPSGLGLPEKNYYYTADESIQQAYKQLIRDVVLYLTATTTEAEKFGNDIFYYEKRIAEVTPDSYFMQNPINTYNSYKLSELKETLITLPLQDILTAMYPESNVTEETEVIVKSFEYLTRVSQIVASTDRTTMNSYLFWTLVRQYLPYLSSKFVSAVDSFNSVLYGVQKPIVRWEFCSNLVQKFMGLAVEVMMNKQHSITNEEQKVVEQIFYSIKSVTKKRLKKYSDKLDLYRHLLQKVINMKLQIGLPNKTDYETYIKKRYTKLIVMKSNLFESYKNGINFLKKMEEKRLIKTNSEDYIIPYILKQPPKVYYSPSMNTVIVPRTFLTEPVFHIKYPLSILYGRLGVEIANAISRSILPYENTWTADLKLLSPFHMTVNESVKIIEPMVNCLSNFIDNNNLMDNGKVNLTGLSTLKTLTALSISHEALLNELKKSQHIHQPTLEKYEDSTLFFLSYSQKLCSVTTPQQRFYDSVVNFSLSQKTLLQVALKHIPDFLSSLSCNEDIKTKCTEIF